jgi:predicted acylesterase/phospholipase RssA
MSTPFDAIVLSGGGLKGCASLGAVAELQAAGTLASATVCAGSSVRSIVAALVALGKPIPEVFRTTIARHKFVPNVDLGNLDRTFGIDSGAGLMSWIQSVLGDPVTFQDIHERTGRTLVVVATDLNTCRPTYFSPSSSPTMDVALALRMSCSVPLMFSAVTFDGKLYCDASITDNFPIEYVVDALGAKNPLGIDFVAEERKRNASWTFDAFVGSVIMSSIAKLPGIGRERNRPGRVLTIDPGPHGARAFDFKMPPAHREAMYDAGRAQAATYLNSELKKTTSDA